METPHLFLENINIVVILTMVFLTVLGNGRNQMVVGMKDNLKMELKMVWEL